jgi:hypothetical protein
MQRRTNKEPEPHQFEKNCKLKRGGGDIWLAVLYMRFKSQFKKEIDKTHTAQHTQRYCIL